MWEIPAYRIRAYVRARREARRTVVQGKPAPRMHLRRTTGELKISGRFGAPSTLVPARVLLNDFSPRGIRIFVHQKIQPGQELSITLSSPRTFYARARVVACNEVSSSVSVITQNRYAYRVTLEFVFDSPIERELVYAHWRKMIALTWDATS